MWNKARNVAAENLKDSDITDAKIRGMVVRKLSDMKTKLDALSRKDPLSSCRFLKEGVELLNVFLDTSINGQKDLVNDANDELGETSCIDQTGMLNEASELSYIIRMLKKDLDKELDSARKRFKEARPMLSVTKR